MAGQTREFTVTVTVTGNTEDEMLAQAFAQIKLIAASFDLFVMSVDFDDLDEDVIELEDDLG